MSRPTKKTLDAVGTLLDAHEKDDAVFYVGKTGESAVIVVNDEALLEVIMVLMNYTASREEEAIPQFMVPAQRIEA
jgi:hypothetical protein